VTPPMGHHGAHPTTELRHALWRTVAPPLPLEGQPTAHSPSRSSPQPTAHSPSRSTVHSPQPTVHPVPQTYPLVSAAVGVIACLVLPMAAAVRRNSLSGYGPTGRHSSNPGPVSREAGLNSLPGYCPSGSLGEVLVWVAASFGANVLARGTWHVAPCGNSGGRSLLVCDSCFSTVPKQLGEPSPAVVSVPAQVPASRRSPTNNERCVRPSRSPL
jgi:hypothetical protein